MDNFVWLNFPKRHPLAILPLFVTIPYPASATSLLTTFNILLSVTV